jgi:TetR/AcrR family transcriptional repressor of nem operon
VPRTGRPRAFTAETVVDQAKDLFWSLGYERTSVQDLVEATGVQRASLYGAFGDKHGLFLQALRRYTDDGAASLAGLEHASPVLPALRAVLRGAVLRSDRERGCLLGNTIAELVPHDRDATEAARTWLAGMEAAFVEALERAGAAGELRPGVDPTAAARLLVVILHGLRLVAKSEAHPQRLVAAADAAIDGLQRERPRPPRPAGRASRQSAVTEPGRS